MSLLEDIFLQDEADEAQQLERVIEGDEYDERPRSRSGSPDSDENEPKDDEAEEDKRRVDPSSTKAKRVTKNPRFILNPARLTGPRGIQILPDHFKDFKFKGKGHEKEDLDMVLKKLEHWAYRLYPKFQFDDCLKKIESLGKKRPVMVHLQKIRTDQFTSDDTVVQKDSSDEETQPPQEQDEFDKLLQQQIDLARATPAPGSVKKLMGTPKIDRSPFTMPKATSSPSISDEQKERMIRNRKLAEERRLARLQQSSVSDKQDNVIIEVDEEAVEENVTAKKHNRSYFIDSSDDECDITTVNQSVTVDVHNSTKKDGESHNDGNVVLEARGNNIDDIEMDENNDAIIDQNVVEIIDDADKDISKDLKLTNTRDKADIIEINDPSEAFNNITKTNDQSHKVDVGIIEINDENSKDFTDHDDGKVMLDAGVNNLDDIEMNENNEDIVDQNVVEIIDDADKDISRNLRVTDIIEINDPSEAFIGKMTEIHDDIEMDENVDNNDGIVNQNVVEIIDDADKDIRRNLEVTNPPDKAVIIEINDPSEAVIGKMTKTNDHSHEDDGIIKINDENSKDITEIIDTNDQVDKTLDDVIEINDNVEIIDNVTHKESRKSNKTEVMKENDNTPVVDANNRSLEVEISNVIDDNRIENQNKPSINEEESTEHNVLEEISSKQDGAVQKDSDLIKNNLEKDAKMAGEVEDVMDVDFSDDF